MVPRFCLQVGGPEAPLTLALVQFQAPEDSILPPPWLLL